MMNSSAEIVDLRKRLAEAEEMLRAIGAGEVDAIVVNRGAAPAVYTLKNASGPYRQLIEQMSEGALTLSTRGVILYCNAAFARMLQRPRERVIGGFFREHFAELKKVEITQDLRDKREAAAIKKKEEDTYDAIGIERFGRREKDK